MSRSRLAPLLQGLLRHSLEPVIPAKAGTHFDFAVASRRAAAEEQRQNGFRLSPE
ncbi:hypothetical protein GLE_0747 [Lysobacter enzymogenes]|uniref:Uncharacterized protein n=1 Tax=Lysobacter enzymogenes TaxID=69 RepID=A0A0S2DC55_LYSEN|nr:hypothetical protein GLE_0747 [Lysobacter enzymogenes]